MATTITWDIREKGQALLAGLGQRLGVDLAAELADITRQLPIMGSFRPMQEAGFVRLHGHQRAFYKTLEPSGVLAFKGTELKVGDLDRAFKELSDEKLSNTRSCWSSSSSPSKKSRWRSSTRRHSRRQRMPMISSKRISPDIARSFQARYDALGKRRDPKQVVDDWVRLFARMLGLGYLPCNLANIGVGQCVDPNNAILDGGFADLDSLQCIADIPDNARFYEAFAYSLASLAGVIQGFLVGSTRLQFHSSMDPLSSLPIHVVCVKLGRMIEEEQANGAKFDPRILGFFANEDPLEILIILCREILPPLDVASHA